jgi:pyruvate dehydrogenase E1 component
VPTLRAYDPAYAHEIAVIVEDGIRRMYVDGDAVFYYLTVANELYTHPAMPDGARDGILRGCYKLWPASEVPGWSRVHLFASGAIVREAQRAQELLAQYRVAAHVWSVTSYLALRRDALAAQRWNMLHPLAEPRRSYLASILADEPYPIVAASDYMKIVADQIAPFVPAGLWALGTDGFGRSDERAPLRRFFEVDAECIVIAALALLAQRGEVDRADVARAISDLGVDPEKADPAVS